MPQYTCLDSTGVTVAQGGAASYDDNTRSFSVTIPTGVSAQKQAITCTLYNVQSAKINIIKDASPADGTNFSFSGTMPGCTSFTLNSTTNVIECTIPTAGAYTVTEATLSGWGLRVSPASRAERRTPR